MAQEYKITTTGTQSPVIFHDLGRREFTHPTTNYDLLANGEFTLDEVTSSYDIQNAISGGHINAIDENNEPILTTYTSQHIHYNKDELDLIDDGTSVITHELIYNHTDLHTRDHNINSTADHNGVSGAIEDNFMSLDSNGLPKDSGYSADDFGSGGGMVPHDLDGTSHIGISGIIGNFMSIDSYGLPEDSGWTDYDFKKRTKNTLYVGENKQYTTIGAAITAADLIADSTSMISIEIDPGVYNENITINDYIILSGKIGTEIYGTITADINFVCYLDALLIENINTPCIIKTGEGTLYLYNTTVISEWTDDSSIQDVIDISEGTIYTLGHSILTINEDSSYTSTRDVCIYNLNGSDQAQIRTISARHIVNASAPNFNLTVVHNTNTDTGNRVEILDCIDTLTATHSSAPANRITLINHDNSVGYSIFDNNKVSAYAPNNAGATYFMPAYCYSGSTWNTVSINKCNFQWADIDEADIYSGASTHSYNALILSDCYFKTGTDIFPSEYTTDGSDGSIFTVMTNTYGSKYVTGSGGNVAITNLAQDITGGWTFKTGSPEFEVSPVFDNDVIWLARNSSDVAESVLWARASDNNTYFNYGSGGHFYLRNNSSVVQYDFTDTELDLNNSDLDNAGRISFEQRTTDVTSPDDGDIWYRSDDDNLRLRADGRTQEVGVVQIVQCYNTTVTDLNTATPTLLPLDAEDFKDALYTHDNATNNSRIEVEADAVYRITYQVNLAGALGRRQVRTRIRVNGTTYLSRSTATSYARNSTDDVATNSCSFLWSLSANDYIEILGDAQGSTGTFNTVANESSLQIELIRYT